MIVTLSNPQNATLGTATHTLTINADAGDPPPTVTFISPASATVDEDAAVGAALGGVILLGCGLTAAPFSRSYLASDNTTPPAETRSAPAARSARRGGCESFQRRT